MTKTLWTIFWSSLYISYLGLISPYFALYLVIINTTKKFLGIGKIRRILKDYGLPKDIRKDVIRQYKEFTQSFSITKLMNYSKISSYKS
ncbi:MAG: hypothetical protein ACTSSG_09350 [Candidatus Heimdallarchaeaceae archaeon]